ncbi:AbrB/MazE/SpoVT family DNA-binding domain-containing protein [Oscillibacter sp. 1-3]|uniref:AbrB/MazE/SpoVT family DNA-binding domain-containing protein n=1 Tax=Oscillibacter sp. 1-3 TaxID=1235797 RepID=UPI000336FEAB|nr:AbrB/MazE/SpoVT family DNA-binding domain-containing protein [Oscillibacter sp. 1-3]EOS63564.1 AbrB family transcriptional regulator [Oscillibacter sp. 1-3]MCI9512360.1 AbrB/MazE/SpoVT family DNA-binding domain-containing protein [Oscillibacter sp.]
MEVPKGRYIFGTVKVGERGQIVIPKEAREVFQIRAGDTMIVLGDEKWGLAVTKADVLERHAKEVFRKIAGGGADDAG